jgi:hypothetical protein
MHSMKRLDVPIARWQYALLVGGAVVVTALVTAAAVYLRVSVLQAAAGVFVVALVVGLFLLPVHWVPSTAVLVLAFFPSRFIPNDGPFRALPPITLILVVWAFRRLVLRQGGSAADEAGLPPFHARGLRLWVYVPAAFMLMWLGYSILTSTSTSTSISWSMSFVLAVITPMLVPDSRREGLAVRKALMWSGAILGAYAVIELVLQRSPIYGTIYDALGRNIDREWSVYRSFASFSHPLAAAAFFTIPAMVSLAEWMKSGRFRYLVLAGGAMLGVFATVSRGSILALAVGAGFVFVCALFDPAVRARGRMLGFVALGLFGAVFAATFAPLQERADSLEAGLSNEARELGLIVAFKAAAYGGWLGTGPGTSGQTARRFDDVVIENSMLQLLISIGIPGLITVVALVAGLIINALGNRDVGAAAATVALAVSFASFNVLDAVLYLHILVGLLVLLSLSSYLPGAAPPQFASTTDRSTTPVPLKATFGDRSWI